VPYTQPVPFETRHRLDEFECGEPALDDWLRRHARQAQAAGSARVFVTTANEGKVVGYYALAAASIDPQAAIPRILKGEARRPVPVVLLARLAVDLSHQSRGVGRSLLQDAVLRCLQASESIGVRAMLVHAKHDAARAWYEKYGFEPSPTDPLHLMILLKDLRARVESQT
jgi:GNAT superfamily N-acetyltransferase